jgi:hypothetical protein
MSVNIFPILLASCFGLYANETNNLFITDDGFLSIHRTQLFEEAKKTKESLPANEFPEGNWGLAQDGFQLSLRFEKPEFTNSEPITAILLLRNVTNHVVTYLCVSEAGNDGPIRFMVTSDSGKTIAANSPDAMTIVSASHCNLVPNTQQRFLESLNKEYNLTNGIYYVKAHLRVACPGCVEVQSAKVPVKIVGSLTTSGQ